jgi:hypothetical protein
MLPVLAHRLPPVTVSQHACRDLEGVSMKVPDRLRRAARGQPQEHLLDEVRDIILIAHASAEVADQRVAQIGKFALRLSPLPSRFGGLHQGQTPYVTVAGIRTLPCGAVSWLRRRGVQAEHFMSRRTIVDNPHHVETK